VEIALRDPIDHRGRSREQIPRLLVVSESGGQAFTETPPLV
jgi:hypothetical protein